jgi:transcriptional regulator with XRE-family HTH domain
LGCKFSGLVRDLHSTRYKKLRRTLSESRRAMGMTQGELATKLRRPQSFVAKYEGGERRLDVIEFLDICGAIGVSPVDVLQKLLP